MALKLGTATGLGRGAIDAFGNGLKGLGRGEIFIILEKF